MKPTILFFSFLLFLPLAVALYGGESKIYDLRECDNFTLDIIGTERIDNGEYFFNYNCIGVQNDYWFCNCTDSDFNITFKINTINNYTFMFDFNSTDIFDDDDDDDDGGSSGGGGGGGYYGLSGNIIRTIYLKQYIYYRFRVDGNTHTIKMTNITNSSADFEVKSNPMKFTLEVGSQTQLDLDSDGKNDVWFKLKEIRGRIAVLELKEVSTPITTTKKETKHAEEVIAETIEEPQETINETATPITERQPGR